MIDTTDTTRTLLVRRELRYRIVANEQTTELVEWADAQQVVRPGELANLSRSGAAVSLSEPLPVGAEISLKLVAQAIGIDLAVAAAVCWSRQAGKNRWWSGISFVDELSEEVFTQLAIAGCVERRQGERKTVITPDTEFAALARWELAPANVPVRITNATPDGFRILSPESNKFGGRVRLQFDRPGHPPIFVRARTCWERAADVGYVIGCECIDKNEYCKLLEAVQTPIVAAAAQPTRPPSRWLR